MKAKKVWAIRVRLQLNGNKRDLALFNRAIEGKLRSRDPVALKVADVAVGERVRERAVIVQQKTGRPVHEQTREAVGD